MTEAASIDELSTLSFGLRAANGSALAWADAIRTEDVRTALDAIEAALQSEPSSPAAKLWWVRCHLELGDLPVAALAAPIEEILPAVRTNLQLCAFAAGTFLKMYRELDQRKQQRLALTMLEHAQELCKELSPSLRRQTDELLLSAIEGEQEAAPLRRESKSYLTHLESKKAEISKELESLSREQPPERLDANGSSTRTARLNSKSILMEAARESEQKQDSAAEGNEWSEGALTPTDRSLGSAQERAKQSRERSAATNIAVFVGLVGALVLLVGVAVRWVFFEQSDSPLEEKLAIAMVSPDLQPPIAPEGAAVSPPSTPAGESNLDKLGKRLAELSLGKKAEELQQVKPIDPNLAKRLPGSGADELESFSKVPEAENAIKEHQLPELDPGKFAKTKVEQVGTSQKRAPVEPEEVQQGRDGRTYGPPRDADPYREPGRKALDGSPLRSYEVQRFDPPLLYRTITATEVLESPSLLSPSLARLDADTPVHVTRRMGQWLELQSSGGRVGYIYAQDATELAATN